MGERAAVRVWAAREDDAAAAGQLLHDFNREFEEPTPPPEALAERVRAMLGVGDTAVLLAGEGTDGPAVAVAVAVVRFRLALWSSGLDAHLAELYVVPGHRGKGIGRALMEQVLTTSRARGADSMDIGVDEPDAPARALYESLGFTNRTGAPPGDLMFFYEREL
jgi:ribosomal protein S18 acetylase RimI-like enzyme